MLPSKAVQNNAMTIMPIMQLFYTLFKTVNHETLKMKLIKVIMSQFIIFLSKTM